MTATSAYPGAAQPSGHSRFGRVERLLRSRPGQPSWTRPALLGLLAGTALLYLVGLGRNGWSNEFYAAAVQAGTKSWKAFLFGSVDSSNFITVDKPAGFLWPMELSARIFGLNSWSLLVPQALEGVTTVGVLYATVRRWFGPAAGLIAGVVTALTPVATLMFRFDNPDAALVLVMTLGAYAITRAVESGRTRWVVLAGALVGLGFLVKMLAAFTVLPGFALVYLWAGQAPIGKRIWQLLAGGAALVVAAGWWVAIVTLTPAASRPYVGGSTDNSILNLTFDYNGLGRLTGSEGAFGGGISGGVGGELGRNLPEAGRGIPGGGIGGMFGGATGITRLFQDAFSGQVAWLIPAALLALAVMLWVSRRAPRTDQSRAAALVWGGWLLVTGLVFSYMSGIIHPYYTIALAPAIGALIGIGSVQLWRTRHTWLACTALAVGLAGTAVWAWFLLDGSPGWFPWLRLVIVVAGVAAAGLVLAIRAVRPSRSGFRRLLASAPVPLAVIAGLSGPLAYSVDTSATVHTGAIPSAGPATAGSLGGPGGAFEIPGGKAFDIPGGTGAALPAGAGGGLDGQASVSAALSKLLEAGAGRYRWGAATVTSTSAASLELGSDGVPVMAIGGFSGSDPAPTLAEFESFVAQGEIHYYVNGGGPGGAGGLGDAGGPGGAGGFGGAPGQSGAAAPSGGPAATEADLPGGFLGAGGTGDASKISSWVEAHFKRETVGGTTVYDLTAPTAGSGPAGTAPSGTGSATGK
jgi:4-amino-4-deoxy-L-arabinose transferase-like glycosyltransferase